MAYAYFILAVGMTTLIAKLVFKLGVKIVIYATSWVSVCSV